MACVSSTSFSININGDLHGYFNGKRGLRQGDPMSPYLFTLVMEILTLLLKRRIREDGEFEYHNKCNKQKIVNICFADDLILFTRGEVHSVSVVWEALEEFKNASGLVPSIPKSTIFFCNVCDHVKSSILHLMPFKEGTLPIKYLGVPLISTRLLYKDCKILVERVQKRISDWKNKWLSFAGHLQLVTSVLSSMHIYWASVFILLAGTIDDIEQMMYGFLWCLGEMKRGKAKVSYTKEILTNKQTLWVRWIHAYKRNDRSFWDDRMGANISWGWRKLLSIRANIRSHILHTLGDGTNTSSWFDQWADIGLLFSHLSYRVINNAGFHLKDKVADIVNVNAWTWPTAWHNHYPILNSLQVPILNSNQDDVIRWKQQNGNLIEFSVRDTWQTIRERGDDVAWYHFVWSKYGIPRLTIHLWLVMRRQLKTQDRLRQWDVGKDVDLNLLWCPLCKLQPDTHEHLFFECSYSSKVWHQVLKVAKFPYISHVWSDIMGWILPMSKSNGVTCIVGCLITSATSYYIWQERNKRIHGKKDRKPEEVTNIIVDMIRLKLASIKFKKKARVREPGN